MAIDDNYTVALLHMDGANASTTFIDESGKTWTATGNAQIDTAQSVFGAASGLFDGTGDYITTADSDDWQLDAGSNSNYWTVDFRVRFNGDPGTTIQGFLAQRADNNGRWNILLNNNNIEIVLRSGGVNTVAISNAWNPIGNQWYHVAIVKNGTSGYMTFIDGSQTGATQTNINTMPNFAANLDIGRTWDSAGTAYYLNGWIDEFRISKGIARWTANFTPPTSEYKSSSNFFYMF